MSRQLRRQLRRLRRSPRYFVVFNWWSWQNWRKGYRFGPVQRHRCCLHTTPLHYEECGDSRG